MAPGVIDALEPVDIEYGQRERRQQGFAARQFMRSRVVEKTPVCGAGEGIRIGKVLQLFLQIVQFGDVAAETDQTCFAIEHDGHLDRPVMPLLAIRAEKGFLEGDFFLFGKHDTVSLREQIGKLLPDQIGFQLADHFVHRLAVGDGNMLVGIEVASLPVLHVNGGIQVVPSRDDK